MIFETHAHFDDEAFDEDREELLLNMKRNGIHPIVNVGASMGSSRESVKLSSDYPNVYAAVGVHPSEVYQMTEADLMDLEDLSRESKVLAIGEIGLDYHYEDTDAECQKYWFIQQLKLAKKVNLPIIIHSREACLDTMEIMKEHAKGLTGVIHCFSYPVEIAREYVKMGFYLGIGGVLTYKNANKLIEVAEEIPLDKLVLETDSPYLTPVPHRGERNDSRNLIYVAEKLAKIKNMPVDKLIKQTSENARNLYRLKKGDIQ
ncbi:MAG: TatD family hydrolase [Lachnospiraceae bacterium]|nr:TatD family hydrolase [Candidatus Merdinaster equi]